MKSVQALFTLLSIFNCVDFRNPLDNVEQKHLRMDVCVCVCVCVWVCVYVCIRVRMSDNVYTCSRTRII